MAFDQLTESSSSSRVAISRRQFLTGAAAVGAGLTVLRPGNVAYGAPLPAPETSGIEHVVLVMMENRSFDHFLGWVPNADGIQMGLAYQNAIGVFRKTKPWAPDFQGCSHPDPSHSYVGGRIEYNGGACDGWLRAGNNDRYAIGFYTENDLDFYRQATAAGVLAAALGGAGVLGRVRHRCAPRGGWSCAAASLANCFIREPSGNGVAISLTSVMSTSSSYPATAACDQTSR
jgi:hypothetical protein